MYSPFHHNGVGKPLLMTGTSEPLVEIFVLDTLQFFLVCRFRTLKTNDLTSFQILFNTIQQILYYDTFSME